MTQEEAALKYGLIENDKWERENDFMVVVDSAVFNLPWDTSSSSKFPHHIYMNKDMVPHFAAAAENLKIRGYAKELKTFDGCFNVRLQRGSSNMWSAHSWGMAIDLNASENPLGGPSKLSKGFVACWKDAGFGWGGDFLNRKDPQHFTMLGF